MYFFFLFFPAFSAEYCMITMAIEGMTWAAKCPLRVTQALEKVPHIHSASTEYKTKKSTVLASEKGCSLESEMRLIQAIEDIGYEAEVLSNKPAKPPQK